MPIIVPEENSGNVSAAGPCHCGCQPKLARRFLLASAASMAVPLAAARVLAQTASAGVADPALTDDLVAVNRILADQGKAAVATNDGQVDRPWTLWRTRAFGK